MKKIPVEYESYTKDDYYGIDIDEIRDFEKIYRFYPYYSEGGFIN